MKISAKKERDLAREKIIRIALELFSTEFDDVMLIESNQFCFPIVGCNDSDLYARVTISIPTGTKSEPCFPLRRSRSKSQSKSRRKGEEN